jgi:hypothetical protein
MKLLLIGPDLSQLISLAVTIDPSMHAIDIIEASRPLETRRRLKHDIAIIWLAGGESCSELQAFLEARQAMRFIFITAKLAQDEHLTHSIARHNVFVVNAESGLVVVTAALVLLASSMGARAESNWARIGRPHSRFDCAHR